MNHFNRAEHLQDMFIAKKVDKEKLFLLNAEALLYEAFKGHQVKCEKQKKIIDKFMDLIEEKFNENS